MGLERATLEFDQRPRLRFGCGSAATVADAAGEFGARVLVVSDRGVVAAGAAAGPLAALAAAGVPHVMFSELAPNPSTAEVEAGILLAREHGSEVVVAVGGGACLDVGKAIALGVANHVPVVELDYRATQLRPGLPVIALPTTAGTGSETNGFGVIAAPSGHGKIYLGGASVQPRLAILDPELTVGLPPALTAAAGMDALSHAVESLAAKHGNPYAEAVALGVARTVAAYLERAVHDGADLEARAELLFAAHVAGYAQQTTGLGVAHAAAHALSSFLGVGHGLACAAMLPGAIRYNAVDRYERYALLAAALGAPDGDAAAAVAALSARIGTAVRLADLGLTPEIATRAAESAAADPVLLNNPRPAAASDIRALLLEAA